MTTFFDYPDGDEGRPGRAAAGGASDELVCFAQLHRAEWDRLLAVMERRRFTAGDVVMRAGDVDRSLYLIATGTVEVRVGEGRDARTVRVQGPGTILGEVAFFDGRPRSATVRALEDGEVLRLGDEAFHGLAGRHPDLGRKILLDLGRVLAVRLRQAEARDGR